MGFDFQLKARAQNAPWNSEVQVVLMRGNDVAENVTFRGREEGVQINPTLSLEREAAQVLMDDLWNCGIRPTEGTGSAGSLRATEKHLEDMRKIAFNGLGI